MLSVWTAPGQTKDILDTGECKILGAVLQANLTWTKHLEKNKGALFPSLRKQLGALQHQGRKIPPQCRKTLVVGLIHSRLIYLIPLWGSVQNNLLRKAQTILNKAARWTSGLSRRTRTDTLMRVNDWLNVREMIFYHGVIQIFEDDKQWETKTPSKETRTN